MLHIHRAERADRLLAALGGVLAEPIEDPLAADVVAVPTRGIERWLSQQLSTVLGSSPDRADGVCANVDFPFPGRLVGRAVAASTGVDRESDPWLPERSVWPLLALVDAHRGAPWLRLLSTHLAAGGDGQRTRRFSVIRALADRFDRYGIHRPAMVRAWAAGADSDSFGLPLAGDVVWQAELWRLLRAEIGVPSPAERLDHACTRLREHPDLADLPARFALFGLTRLPASYLAVLDALAATRDVHLLLLHPSPVLWEAVAGIVDAATPLRRSEDPTATVASNPLLGSWGRDGREMQLVVAGVSTAVREHHHAAGATGTTLLERLQDAVRRDEAPPGAPLADQQDTRPTLDRPDDSVQVNACHSRARQVEVMRDAILHLLEDHRELEPRDIVVMCPDVETFAPLIHAAFGPVGMDDDPDGAPAHGGPRPPGLRVRLADRSLRQTNPVLQVVSDLLDLADARLTASQVLDLAAREPVRRRFRLSTTDLERLEGWVAAAGVRWGLDAAHRTPYQLHGVAQNTWRAGLDRVLLGTAVDESGLPLIGHVLPLDDVGSGDIDLAGRFAELIARLARAVDRLRDPKSIAGWVEALSAIAGELVATAEADAWQHAQLERLLAEVAGEAGSTDSGKTPAAATSAVLDLAEVRALLADRLRGRPTTTSFRTGHLTICTLVPMRSVPHKVIGLLGLDDGWFPRPFAPDGDDLIARDPHVGDRDPRSEDRQLLLDALLAATNHLIVTYTGRDQRTNLPRPPSVPVGELLDAIDRTVRTGEVDHEGQEVPARERICIQHPLQLFDPRNFATTARDGAVPARWSYDEVALAGARALAAGPFPVGPFLPAPLPPVATDALELAELERFLQHPVKAFLRQRLVVSLTDRDDEPGDTLPVDLDGLEQWQVGQNLLEARMAGVALDHAIAAERARGTLPPGALADRILEQVAGRVEQIVAAAQRELAGAGTASSLDVHVDLEGDGTSLLTGTVPQVGGDVLWQVTYSRVAAKHRLAGWVRLLAATAAHPERVLSAVTIGRGRDVTVARIPCLADTPDTRRDVAVAQLRILTDLYRRGLCEPLPLYCATSAAYAAAHAAGTDPGRAARDAWETGGGGYAKEDSGAEHILVHGSIVGFDRLLEEPPCEGEDADGWAVDEGTRFGRYARRLWDGLLALEDLS